MQNEIWMMENCAWCKKAKQLLDDYGFDYVYINAKANQAEFRAKFPDAKTLPQIIFQGEKVGGYDGLVEDFHNKNIYIGNQEF